MPDFSSLRDKFRSTVSVVADRTKDLAEKTADKAKSTTRIAKLTMEINSEKDALKKTYAEIGKLYYETRKDEPDGFFVQLCDEVTIALENIAEKEAEIATLKAGGEEESIDVEFEEVVAEAEAEAAAVEETIEQAVEEAAEEIKEKAEEAAETVEEVKEKAEEVMEEIKDQAPDLPQE